MRKLTLILALSCVSLGFADTTSARTPRPQDCRPLTEENAAVCCAAAGLRNTLRPQDAALCLTRRTQTFASPPTALGTPPGVPNPPGGTDNPPGIPDKGANNGFGNGVQDAPGDSGPHNNANNANPSRSNPGNSAH